MKDAGSGLTVEEEDDICDMFTNRLDSQTFSFICDELVKAMGFNIVKKLVTDTFVEGEGADYICTRPKDPSKYFIAVRRWGTNEIGKIAILDISQRAAENNCDRVVIVSSAPLTSEAQEYVEKSKNLEFHTCREMAVLLKSIIPSV
jgi:HJR/Mrr/RecB family endonuclease